MKTITKSKLEKYYIITNKALEIAKKSAEKETKKGKGQQAKEIFLMVECYLKDAKYFQNKKNFVNSFGCLNYAHGWLDAGARLKIFKVKDNKLFAV